MKKLMNVLMITLALNFIALAAGVGYLFKTGALSREKVASIKTILYPATTQAAIKYQSCQLERGTLAATARL